MIILGINWLIILIIFTILYKMNSYQAVMASSLYIFGFYICNYLLEISESLKKDNSDTDVE